MRFTEPLNNGLVTSRSPILLREGELQRADNAYYQPNDTGLHAAPTETTAMVAPGLGYFTPTGIVHCAFDFVEAKCDLTLASTAVVITPLIINNVTTTNTSLIITAPSGNNFVSILKGATISGTGIPANTTVTSIDSPTQITMSLAATATGTPNLTFTNAKFSNVTAGASIAGPGIPDGTTASSVGATGTSLVLSVAATRTGQSKLIVKADNLVVLQIDNKYKKAKSGAAGTALSFSDLDTGITEGTALEQVHYNNLHVLLNGKHENRVLMADGLTRSHGLNPVTASCNPIPTTGVWALKDGVGFYAYWTTEYDSINDIESDYNPGVDPAGKPIKPPMVEITSITTQAVQVTRPARVNDTATHWRLYRSVKYTSTTAKSAAKENQYPNGWLVAEIELRDDNQQDTFVDGGDLSQTVAATAGNASSGAGASGLVWANTGAATGVINNGGATNDTNSATLTYAGAKESLIPLSLTNFSIPSVGSPVTGITITVTGRRVGGGKLILEVLSTRHPFSTTIPIGRKVVPYTTSNASYTLGGTSELWGRKWDPSDFANGKFQINCYGSVVVTSDKVTVDAISVIVSHGESQDSGTGAYLNNITDPYPGIVVSPYGFQISAGRGDGGEKCGI